MSRVFAVVVAHPDDEAFSWAGTVALHADDSDFRFILIHATHGEAGDIRPGFAATPATLGRIRQAESEAAWQAVGRTPDRHEWLGYPDGSLAEVPAPELTGRIHEVLDAEKPDVVATFGPDGITGHPDHITVGACTDAAFAELAQAEGRGFKRLLHHVLPQSIFDRWQQQRRDLDLPVFDPTKMYHGRGVPDEQVHLIVDCRSVASRIVAGILQHQSQLHVMADQPVNEHRLARIVSWEWATIAWPPTTEMELPLTDVFEFL
ncbi:PIG-L family deacetylase [Pedococcus bigeumensis]|jgi:N-acetyl-1-D-myo-inositol-2-amino-2-deoxy-alpha-D-glucopyranoside deacetylase|uniref:PIG-L deacetylase family protein n=1 Tax=Pedococcus bigeumensis TaxID=433644 RepID=UPI002FEA2CDF